jgi:hypothetical protein
MNSIVRGSGFGLPWRLLALSLGVGLISAASSRADDASGLVHAEKKAHGWSVFRRFRDRGTLGYGPPGVHPGFQGFGLGYHPGYGYGGDALGVGAEGGYPFYGGPGYPHPAPRLRRIGGINPFPHFAGPGSPTPAHPNFYGGVGPLITDEPVIAIIPEPGEAPQAVSFGAFTGAVPLPEAYFAPYTSEAASLGSASGVSTARPASTPPNTMPHGTAPLNPNPRD